MKKLFIGIIIGALLASALCFGAGLVDFSKFSNSELLQIETDIQAEKIARKMAKYAIVPAGTYEIGVDIPAGSYSIERTKNSQSSMVVYTLDANGYATNAYYIGDNSEYQVTKVTKCIFKKGEFFQVPDEVKITIYTGGITFN